MSKPVINYVAFFHTRRAHTRARARGASSIEEFPAIRRTKLKRALEHDPAHFIALGNYANLPTDVRGDHDGALVLIERALFVDPTQAQMHCSRPRLTRLKADISIVARAAQWHCSACVLHNPFKKITWWQLRRCGAHSPSNCAYACGGCAHV